MLSLFSIKNYQIMKNQLSKKSPTTGMEYVDDAKKNFLDSMVQSIHDPNNQELQSLALAHQFLVAIDKQREAKGMTKSELAQLVGTTPSFLTQLNTGVRTPSFRMIQALGTALDIDFVIQVKSKTSKRSLKNHKLTS